MDAPLSLRRVWIAVDAPPLAALVRAITAALLALLALAACVVWIRRATGAVIAPLPAEAMIAVGAALALAALAFRASWHTLPNASHARIAVPTIIATLAAAALCLPDSPPAGLTGLWALVILEEGWAWRRFLRPARSATEALLEKPATPRLVPGAAGGLLENPSGLAPGATGSSPETPVPLNRLENDLTTAVDTPDQDSISQYLVRHQTDEGETLEGWTRVQFEAGQRHATAHVAICPPFARTPQCFAEIADGTSGDVKIGQVLPYGVRFDLKLDKPATEPTSVTVEFSIQEHVADGEPG